MRSIWSHRSIAAIISIGLALGMVAVARQRVATRTLRAHNAATSPQVGSFRAQQTQLGASNRANADAPPTIQFSSIVYSVSEADGFVTVTINRTGDASQPANVDYATSDNAGSQNCNVVSGLASSRCDYLSALGTLKFASGETSKTVSIQIVDDSYAEGPEIFTIGLSNPTSPAVLGAPTTAIVTINDNDASNGVNPIDNATFFIRQQYIDFLNRQPDDSGLNFWSSTITSCGSDQQCIAVKRVNASGAFFLSIEFQNTGYLIYRIYKSAYGNISSMPVPIRLNEFLPDTQEIGQGVIVNQANWQQQLESNKQAFTLEFVQRSRFTGAFPTTLTPAQFVDAMFLNGGVTPSTADRNTAIAEFGGAGNTIDVNGRSRALRDVAENSTLQQQESNRAFVLMQYFGYLRRNPNDAPDADFSGYTFWLNKLNSFGNYVDAEMVKAFILSGEYRQRFGAAGATSSPTPTPTPTPAPTPSPTPTPSQGGLTPEEREAAGEAVRAQFESLSNSGLSKDDVNQQLLAFIRSRPEFADAGISTDSCVWATFIDGVGFIVYNNLDPPALTASTAQPTTPKFARMNVSPEACNGIDKANLQWGLGPAFDRFDPTADIAAWLCDNYYGVTNEEATVESLRTVGGSNQRVLFLAGHGGGVPYSVTTLSPVSAAKERADQQLADDLKSHRLVQGSGLYARTPDGKEEIATNVYAITSEFIKYYWQDFPSDSFVFNDSCSSASPAATAFIDAIKAKKVSVYAGWTQPAGSAKTPKFVFDRLLGGNHVFPEDDGYKQRPFDYNSVAQDFQYHGVGRDESENPSQAQLVFKELSTQTSTNGFKTLAPSIYRVFVDEYPVPPSPQWPSGLPSSELRIDGIFGEDPGESNRSVTVGDQPCADIKWVDAYELRCHLPVSGKGSAGAIVVSVKGHLSNTATLTQWEGYFTHLVSLGVNVESGFLKQTALYDVRFRADVRKARAYIHEPPTFDDFGLPLSFDATEDSQYSYKCEGTLTALDGNYMETWSTGGPGVFLRGANTTPLFTMLGVFKNESSIKAGLSVRADYLHVAKTIGSLPLTYDDPLFDPLLPPDGISTFILSLDGKFNISGDTQTWSKDTGDGIHGTWSNTLQWDSIQANFLPDPNTAR